VLTVEAYSCVDLAIQFRRQVGYHVLHNFIPSILIVVLSWVSFWVSLGSGTARLFVGLMTIFTMTMVRLDVRTHLVEVSYVTAIDVWVFVCLLFVVGAFVEFVALCKVTYAVGLVKVLKKSLIGFFLTIR
jgi:hypothetical protein